MNYHWFHLQPSSIQHSESILRVTVGHITVLKQQWLTKVINPVDNMNHRTPPLDPVELWCANNGTALKQRYRNVLSMADRPNSNETKTPVYNNTQQCSLFIYFFYAQSTDLLLLVLTEFFKFYTWILPVPEMFGLLSNLNFISALYLHIFKQHISL